MILTHTPTVPRAPGGGGGDPTHWGGGDAGRSLGLASLLTQPIWGGRPRCTHIFPVILSAHHYFPIPASLHTILIRYDGYEHYRFCCFYVNHYCYHYGHQHY